MRKQTKERRPKGMGSISFYNDRKRTKPYAAYPSATAGYPKPKAIGYYASYEQSELHLLIYYLKRCGKMPKEIQGDLVMEMEYANYITEYQRHKVLPLSVWEFGDISYLNEPFIAKINANRASMANMISVANNIPTFSAIWEEIKEHKIDYLSESTQSNYRVAFNHLKELHDYSINQINWDMMQSIFTDLSYKKAGYSKLNNMRVVCNYIFEFAFKHQYVDRNYASYIEFKWNKEKDFTHIPFSHEEIVSLWEDESEEANLVLIYIYTGLRPQELIAIKKSDVYLNRGYMIGGMKTDNGKDRIIPIHPCIKPIIDNYIKSNEESDYLIFKRNTRAFYNKYRTKIFRELMKKSGMKHHPYDTRHTFATLCDEFNIQLIVTKAMMGHSNKDLTRDVYTHVSKERIASEIKKIPGKEEFRELVKMERAEALEKLLIILKEMC